MPNIHTNPFNDSTVLMWNTDVPVGGSRGVSAGQSVKLVQYLLFRSGLGDTDGSLLPRERVTGSWDSTSNGALKALEKQQGVDVVADGVIDPMRPGQAFGSISHKRYKVGVLNGNYIRSVTGIDPRVGLLDGSITIDDCNDTVLAMPDNDDIPADLASILKGLRTAFQGG